MLRSEVTCGLWSPRQQPGSPQNFPPTLTHSGKQLLSQNSCASKETLECEFQPKHLQPTKLYSGRAGDHQGCRVTGNKWPKKIYHWSISPCLHTHTRTHARREDSTENTLRINPDLRSKTLSSSRQQRHVFKSQALIRTLEHAFNFIYTGLVSAQLSNMASSSTTTNRYALRDRFRLHVAGAAD